MQECRALELHAFCPQQPEVLRALASEDGHSDRKHFTTGRWWLRLAFQALNARMPPALQVCDGKWQSRASECTVCNP